MKIRAEMGRQRAPLCPAEYQVDKVVDIPNTQFAALLMRPLDSYDFIRHNSVEPHQGTGYDHCLLVLGEGRTDGVLVQCSNDGRAAYSAYVTGARDVVQARLDRVADFIIGEGTRRTASGSWYVYCEELDEKFGVAIQEGNGLDAMLKDTLERRPEVAQVDISLQHIETTFHPEFCVNLSGSAEETQPDIRLRDILPLLTNTGLEYPCQSFFTHQETDIRVWPDDLRKLTTAGQREHGALLNARVAEIVPTDEGVKVALTNVDPQELVRFNQAYEDHQTAEWAMGDMTP